MLIGFAGGLAVLVSFAGVATGRLSASSTTYHAMNLAGAIAMVASGLPADAWPSVAVNVTWALISAHGLLQPRGRRPASVSLYARLVRRARSARGARCAA